MLTRQPIIPYPGVHQEFPLNLINNCKSLGINRMQNIDEHTFWIEMIYIRRYRMLVTGENGS